MKYSQHPLSSAFPAMSAEEFTALKDSIGINGVLNPITIFEGMVIDGWHRYRAANELGMDCPEVDMDGSIDPKDFVMAQNKARRHILPAQLLAAAKAVYAWAPVGRPVNSAVAAELTTKQASEKTGVSVRNVERFKEIEKKAAPEVLAGVLSGSIGLTKGAAISKLPAQEQAAAIDKPLPKPEKISQQAPAQAIPDDDGPDADELAANAMAAAEDAKCLALLLEADDKLAFAVAEVKRLNALNANLQLRINGLMNEKNEAVKAAKSLERQLQRLRKEDSK